MSNLYLMLADIAREENMVLVSIYQKSKFCIGRSLVLTTDICFPYLFHRISTSPNLRYVGFDVLSVTDINIASVLETKAIQYMGQ